MLGWIAVIAATIAMYRIAELDGQSGRGWAGLTFGLAFVASLFLGTLIGAGIGLGLAFGIMFTKNMLSSDF